MESGMQFIFFRCWPGFADTFPFERFNHLADDDAETAVTKFAQDQFAELRDGIEQCDAEEARIRIERIRAQQGSFVAVSDGVQRHKTTESRNDRDLAPELPEACRLGSRLGWFNGAKSFYGDRAVGPRIWLAEGVEGFADQVVQSCTIDMCERDLDRHFRPRLGTVRLLDMDGGTVMEIRRKIQQLERGRLPNTYSRRPGQPSTPAEIHQSLGLSMLEVVDGLREVWTRVAEAAQGSSDTREGAAALPKKPHRRKSATQERNDAAVKLHIELNANGTSTYDDTAAELNYRRRVKIQTGEWEKITGPMVQQAYKRRKKAAAGESIHNQV